MAHWFPDVPREPVLGVEAGVVETGGAGADVATGAPEVNGQKTT